MAIATGNALPSGRRWPRGRKAGGQGNHHAGRGAGVQHGKVHVMSKASESPPVPGKTAGSKGAGSGTQYREMTAGARRTSRGAVICSSYLITVQGGNITRRKQRLPRKQRPFGLTIEPGQVMKTM